MTHEFMFIYGSKARVTGQLLPHPSPSVEWIQDQVIDFALRYPDYSGVVVLKVKYDLNTRKVLHVWCHNPATFTWQDANYASVIRFAEHLFDANRQEVLRQVHDALQHPATAVLDRTPAQQTIVDFVVLYRKDGDIDCVYEPVSAFAGVSAAKIAKFLRVHDAKQLLRGKAGERLLASVVRYDLSTGSKRLVLAV